jgi:hypothetical protein
MRRYIFLVLIQYISTVLYCQEDNKDIIIIARAKEVVIPKTLKFEITVKSQTNISIHVPDKDAILFGYKDDDEAQCYFEVYELNGESEQLVDPTADYQYFPGRSKKKLLLGKGQSISYEFNVSNFYRLKVGKRYKIRLVFKGEIFNKTENIASNWVNVP